MLSSVTAAFTESEDFEAALRADGCVNLLVTGRGQFRARLTRVALHFLRLTATKEHLSRIAFLVVPGDMVLLMFSMDDAALPACGGVAPRSGEIITLGPGEQLHVRTDSPTQIGAIWLPVKELAEYGGALIGVPFAIPPAVQLWCPLRKAGKRLRRLHTAAIRTAVRLPQALTDADAAHGLEQQLIHAVVGCLAGGSLGPTTQSRRRHQDIMVRFERLLLAEPERDMDVMEICTSLNVSERLLRSLCAEHLGMGPVSYDRLRRMSLVRRVLRQGNSEATVATVARRYGFRSPGRFAVNYRSAFGASPSATLRRD